MIISDYSWLLVIIRDYSWLLVIIDDYHNDLYYAPDYHNNNHYYAKDYHILYNDLDCIMYTDDHNSEENHEFRKKSNEFNKNITF